MGLAPVVLWEGCLKTAFDSAGGNPVWDNFTQAGWQLNVIDAGKDSAEYVVKVWNGKDPNTGILGQGFSNMEDVKIITKTTPKESTSYPGNEDSMPSEWANIVYDNTNDPVGGQWVCVHRPEFTVEHVGEEWADYALNENSELVAAFKPIGAGAAVSIKAAGSTNYEDFTIFGDEDSLGITEDMRYSLFRLKIVVPDNAISGEYSLLTRIEYKFV